MRALVPLLLLFAAACGPRIEFTPHSALQAQEPRVCRVAVELFEGDMALLQQAGAVQVGKLDVTGSEYDPEDVTARAAEHGATHLVRTAQQRQIVQSGAMMVGTGGWGWGSGMMVPTTREETYATYTLYRADLDRMPAQLRCPR